MTMYSIVYIRKDGLTEKSEIPHQYVNIIFFKSVLEYMLGGEN